MAGVEGVNVMLLRQRLGRIVDTEGVLLPLLYIALLSGLVP